MDERHATRKHLIYYLRAFEMPIDRYLGQVVDLTEDGFMLVSADPIDEGVSMRVRIHLPKPIDGFDDLGLTAACRWCRRDSNPEFFRVGYRIGEISKPCLEVVRKLMQEYEFQGEIEMDLDIDLDENLNR